MSEKEFLFLGVADSFETAKLLEGYYEANGFDDVLPKQIPIAEKTVSDINESEKGFLEGCTSDFSTVGKGHLKCNSFWKLFHLKLVKKLRVWERN